MASSRHNKGLAQVPGATVNPLEQRLRRTTVSPTRLTAQVLSKTTQSPANDLCTVESLAEQKWASRTASPTRHAEASQGPTLNIQDVPTRTALHIEALHASARNRAGPWLDTSNRSHTLRCRQYAAQQSPRAGGYRARA
ncbi:hypothetical protein N7G274_008381 [Stereocaulon virgatum]|uniref:Uncharacterized protein n=1 Tax=Stereocaulon virgatum TaxID=373712 RepID=A0ABR4A044_9LECA